MRKQALKATARLACLYQSPYVLPASANNISHSRQLSTSPLVLKKRGRKPKKTSTPICPNCASLLLPWQPELQHSSRTTFRKCTNPRCDTIVLSSLNSQKQSDESLSPNPYIHDPYPDIDDDYLHGNPMYEEIKSEEKDENMTRTPTDILLNLNRHVIGQNKAKTVLSVATYNHYKRVRDLEDKAEFELKYNEYDEYLPKNRTSKKIKSDTNDISLEKSNILLLGPTGSGKTLVTKTLAKATGVPFSMADATTLTQAGYVGEDVESIISKLVTAAEGDISRAERGIVFIDEVDKIAARQGQNQRDVGGEGVQQSLLKLLEGSIVTCNVKNSRTGKKDQVEIDTQNILFVCSGAFSGMDSIIAKRKEKKLIGFNNIEDFVDQEEMPAEVPWDIMPVDLQKFGMIPEFIGRLPVIVALHQLSKEDLIRILVEPDNALVPQFAYLFKLDNSKLTITDCALEAIAEKAIVNETGARGLRAIMEKLLLQPMFDIPHSSIDEVIITAEVVRGDIPPIYQHSSTILPTTNVLPTETTKTDEK